MIIKTFPVTNGAKTQFWIVFGQYFHYRYTGGSQFRYTQVGPWKYVAIWWKFKPGPYDPGVTSADGNITLLDGPTFPLLEGDPEMADPNVALQPGAGQPQQPQQPSPKLTITTPAKPPAGPRRGHPIRGLFSRKAHGMGTLLTKEVFHGSNGSNASNRYNRLPAPRGWTSKSFLFKSFCRGKGGRFSRKEPPLGFKSIGIG